MKIFHDIKDFNNFYNQEAYFTATIGNFDGVHLGHQSLFKALSDFAKKKNQQNLVITFTPNSKLFFHERQQNHNFLLSTDQEKIALLDNLNIIDNLIFLKFDEKLQNLSPENFIQEILSEKLKVNSMIIGENFYFGKEKMGNIQLLEEYFGKNMVIPLNIVSDRELKYSSTAIKTFLHNGEIEKANKLLSYNYCIQEKVVKGKQIASSTLNFPTVNIINNEKILPKFGVYKVLISIEGDTQKYIGLANVGVKPTISKEKQPMIEVHIKNFSQDIYDKKVKIEFLQFIREEKKFNDINELKTQIQKDINQVFQNE